jgi:putative MATE family efflux protein
MNAPATKTSKLSYYISLIKRSLNGEEVDYTQGSMRMAIFLLAVPMILEMMMESVFAVVDIYFVGRLGDHAVATVVLTESVIMLLYSAAMAFSIGATSMVARRVGEKNQEGAALAGAQAINLAIIVAAVMSIVGVFFARNILEMMDASEAVLAVGVPYTQILFGSSIVIFLLFLINGVFRGAGNASMAMKSLWFAHICNIILCPIMIYFFDLPGAAMATAMGRGLGVCYQLYHLLKGSTILKVARHHFQLHWNIIRDLFKISWMGFVQFAIATASWMFLTRIMSSYHNDNALAGYGVAMRIIMFFILPAWGMSNAAATLVGQNLGALQPDRAELSVKKTAKYNAIFMAIVTFIFLVFADYIVAFMNQDPEVVSYAVTALRIISLGYIFYGIGMVMIQAFNGAGDTTTPTLVNFFGFWLLQIPLAWFLAKELDLKQTGVFMAIPLSETAITIASMVLFKRGKWKLKKV